MEYMIERFFTTEYTTYRQVWTDQKSEEAVVGTFKGHIQQSTGAETTFAQVMTTTTFTIFCGADTDVLIGDRVSDGLDDYSVRQVAEMKSWGDNKHLEVICEKLENDFISV